MASSDPDFVVLHTLRCIGFSGDDRIAAASGLGPHETSVRLRTLQDRGLVEYTSGHFGGWGLSDLGRSSGDRILRAELEAAGALDHVTACYETFFELNPVLLTVVTDWQMRSIGGTPIVNDHTDSGYDASVLSRLMKVDESAQQVCADLAARLARFSNYGSRLNRALDRVMAGEVSMLGDSLDSYHSVWFQLHEDLLLTLGRSRDAERRSQAAGG